MLGAWQASGDPLTRVRRRPASSSAWRVALAGARRSCSRGATAFEIGRHGHDRPSARRRLTKRTGASRRSPALTLDIGRGVTGLLGPNGAGKTTLLRILATVLAPDGGELRLLGRDPRDADERIAIRRRLGYLPQEPGFHRHFTAFEFVDYIAILKEWADRGARHDEVRRVLRAVGLDDVAHRRIRALSGGMRRRVALAQALLGSPELLVLDEPTAGLDPEQRLRFRELVSRGRRASHGRCSRRTRPRTSPRCARASSCCATARSPSTARRPSSPRSPAAGSGSADDRDARRDGGVAHRRRRAPPRRRAARRARELVEPTLEDGYLMLLGSAALPAVAA